MIAKRRAAAEIEKKQWERMKKYFNHRCLCCAQRAFFLTKDHVIPKALGGPNCLENYQPLCMACNLQKGTEIVDYRWRGWREALSS
jgi:5-methylcytosine-specific restriction endonuclease McrA